MKVKRERQRVKDPADKVVMRKPENFAAIFNLALTGGKQKLVKPEDLVELDPNKTVFFDTQGNSPTGERRMDVEKEWIFKQHRNGRIAFAMRLHMELQSSVDYFMPVRALVYSAADYDDQLRKNKRRRKSNKLIPVLPLITNLSLEPWTGYTTFQECLSIPESLKPYVSDYIPNFRILLAEPRKGIDYSNMSNDVSAVFKVFSVKDDLGKIMELVDKEKIFNDISNDAYNMIRSRLNLDFLWDNKNKRVYAMKRINVFHETEKRQKRVDAELSAKATELNSKEKDLESRTNELETKENELETKENELETKENELETKENELTAQQSEVASKIRNTVENMLRRGFSYKDISDIVGLEISVIEEYASALAAKEPEYSVK